MEYLQGLAAFITVVFILALAAKFFQFARSLLMYALFTVLFLLTVIPIIWLIYSSFKSLTEINMSQLALPRHWIIDNYKNAWVMGKLGIYIINSVLYTTVTTALVVIFGLMASFAFSKLRGLSTPVLHGIFIIGILITLQSILIPLFIMLNIFHLTNSRLGVIISYIGIFLPLCVYLGTEFIKSIPDSIIESARIDGAGYIRIFFSIVLPMTKPVVTTIIVLTVLGVWNEFMFNLVLSSSDSVRSLPVGIFSFAGPLATQYGMQYAALVIGLVPMLLFYMLFSRKITEGVAGGAIKG